VGLAIVVKLVADFDSLEPTLLVEPGLFLAPAAALYALPAGVVPEDERLLLGGLLELRIEIGRVQWRDVGEEDGVEVTRRRVVRDLGAADEEEALLPGALRHQFIRAVEIVADVLLVRAVFDVVRDGQYVEALAPGLVNAYGRPHVSVGEHRMRMEVALQRHVPGYVREADFTPLVRHQGTDATGQDQHCYE